MSNKTLVKFTKEYKQCNGNSGTHFVIPAGTLALVDESEETIEEVHEIKQHVRVDSFQPAIFKGNTDELKYCYVPAEYLVRWSESGQKSHPQ